MAKSATKDEIRALEDPEDLVAADEFLALDAPPGPRRKPIVEATVVYLGGHPHYSCSMRGRVFEERVEQEDGSVAVTKRVADAGFTKYVFETHDRLGRLERRRIMPARAPVGARGRPCAVVQHPDHIMRFDEGIRYREDGRLERFLVLFTGPERDKHKRIMDEYAARVRRYRQQEQDELAENTAGSSVRAV